MRVLITGAGTGIGAAVADALEEDGHEVVVCGRRPIDRPGALSWDVTQDPDGLVAAAGPLDALVNNAGHAEHRPVEQWTEDLWESHFRVHVLAPALLSRAFAAQGRPGCIVNICSTLAVRPARGTGPYAAAKAALLSQTRTLALELAPRVRVNALLVGGVRSDMTAGREAELEGLHPLGLGQPADVADAVNWLLKARWVTGAGIAVDGGLST